MAIIVLGFVFNVGMLHFIQGSKRGGLWCIAKWYCKTNKKWMKNYDFSVESFYNNHWFGFK